MGIDTLMSSVVPVDSNLFDCSFLVAETGELTPTFLDFVLDFVIQLHQSDTLARG